MTSTLSQLYHSFKRRRGRRIFIVPTRFGFLYAALLILILLGSINYSNSLGHLLCFLLASLGQLSMFYTYRNLAKIELTQAPSTPVFSGQMINFTLSFTNPTPHATYQIEVSSKQSFTKSWNPFSQLTGYQHPKIIAHLKPQQLTKIVYSVPSQQRGKHHLGRIRIASTFPLGLFNTWSYFKNDYSAIVYPKPQGLLPRPIPSTSDQQHQQQRQQKGLDDFSGFNTYRQGDPIHTIAWKAVARDTVLRTKQFSSPEGAGKVILRWQDVEQLATLELKLSQLCQWVLDTDKAGISYSLVLPNNTIAFGHGEAHRHTCLTALALYE